MTNPTTPHFGLTYLTAGQLQPEVTLNGNMVLVDALTQPSTISITTTTPPASPADGATYIVPTGATGAWASAAVGSLTVWSANNGAWSFYAPQTGWTVYNQSNNTFYAYNGTTWAATAGSSGSIAALTGDVTASGTGSVVATIAAHAVTNAKAAQMAANTLKGNNTGSTANAADLTVAQVSTLLGLGSAALQPSSAFDAAGAAAAVTASLAPGSAGTVQALGDANATIANGTATAIITTALTAARTYTLPAASSYAAGFRMLLADITGSLTATNTATIVPNGSDTINGTTSYVLSNPYAQACVVTDGANKWTVRVVTPLGSATPLPVGVSAVGASANASHEDHVHPAYTQQSADTATLGAELTTNGGFAGSASGWTLGADWAYGSNSVVYTSGGTSTLSQSISVTAGTYYLITWTQQHSAANNANITPAIGAGNGTATAYGDTAAHTVQQVLLALSSGSLTLSFTPSAASGGTVTIGAVSVKALTAVPAAFSWLDASGTVVGEHRISASARASVGVGLLAQAFGMTGSYNIAFGTQAQIRLVGGSNNTAVGHIAQSRLTNGSANTALGYSSQAYVLTGVNNTAVGSQTQVALTTGANNLGLGATAQYSLTTGSQNVAVGAQSQYNLTIGVYNTGVGMQCQRAVTTGGYNVAIGGIAQFALTTGAMNVGIGYCAQYSLTTPANNIAIGPYAQYSVTTGGNNTALGYQSQRYTNAGGNLTTVSNSVCIGYDSRQSADGDTNEIVIGAGSRGNGSNTATIGNASTTDTYLSGRVRAGTVVTPATYLVAALPTSGTPAGSNAYASNGRKAGEGAGAGTGIPTWFDGTNWRTYYDNTVTAA